jgi:hypothetical protein
MLTNAFFRLAKSGACHTKAGCRCCCEPGYLATFDSGHSIAFDGYFSDPDCKLTARCSSVVSGIPSSQGGIRGTQGEIRGVQKQGDSFATDLYITVIWFAK